MIIFYDICYHLLEYNIMSDYGQEYGEEDIESMLQPFRQAFDAMGLEKVDKEQLKEIFEAMGQTLQQDEFENQFQSIDTDGDGLITFEDFKRQILSLNENPEDIGFYTVQDENIPGQPPTVTANTLSILNEIFEKKKVPSEDGNKYVVDLKLLRYQLEQQEEKGEKPALPLEVFDIFFGNFTKKKGIISMYEFSELIAEAEDRLFQIGGEQIQEVEIQQQIQTEPLQDTPKPQKLGQTVQQSYSPEREIEANEPDEDFNYLDAKLKQQMKGTGTQYANKQRNDSIRVQREAETSLYAYAITELSAHTETPEVQLAEVLSMLTDSGQYDQFKQQDWTIFFKIFSKKFENVTQRINNLENKEQERKASFEQFIAEKNDLLKEVTELTQMKDQAFQENANLTEQLNQYDNLQEIFEETQKSEEKYRNLYQQAQNMITDYKAQAAIAKQNEREAREEYADYIDQISELKIELRSLNEVLREEGNEKMRLKQESIRQSMMVQRQSTVQGMISKTIGSPALQGIRESTLMRFGQKKSQDEEEIKQMNSDLEDKYMNALSTLAMSNQITDEQRKGTLMIAQQFERYRKAYELVKKEKDQLIEENEQILRGVEKLDKRSESRKQQNEKDRKEIEKLKTKVANLCQQRDELIDQINNLRIQITMVNSGVIRKVKEQPAPFTLPVTGQTDEKKQIQGLAQKNFGVNRATDVGAIKSRFGAKQLGNEATNQVNVNNEEEIELQEDNQQINMEQELQQHFGETRDPSESLFNTLEQQEYTDNDEDDRVLNAIRDSRFSRAGSLAGSMAYVIPTKSGKIKKSEQKPSDYFTQDLTREGTISQVLQKDLALSNNITQTQLKAQTASFQSKRKISFPRGTQFRPTVLGGVKEEDEDDGRSTVQSQFVQENEDQEFFAEIEMNDDNKSLRFEGSEIDRTTSYRSSNMIQKKRLQSAAEKKEERSTFVQEIQMDEMDTLEQFLEKEEDENNESKEVKNLDMLLKQLEQKKITKRDFINKIAQSLQFKQQNLLADQQNVKSTTVEDVDTQKNPETSVSTVQTQPNLMAATADEQYNINSKTSDLDDKTRVSFESVSSQEQFLVEQQDFDPEQEFEAQIEQEQQYYPNKELHQSVLQSHQEIDKLNTEMVLSNVSEIKEIEARLQEKTEEALKQAEENSRLVQEVKKCEQRVERMQKQFTEAVAAEEAAKQEKEKKENELEKEKEGYEKILNFEKEEFKRNILEQQKAQETKLFEDYEKKIKLEKEAFVKKLEEEYGQKLKEEYNRKVNEDIIPQIEQEYEIIIKVEKEAHEQKIKLEYQHIIDRLKQEKEDLLQKLNEQTQKKLETDSSERQMTEVQFQVIRDEGQSFGFTAPNRSNNEDGQTIVAKSQITKTARSSRTYAVFEPNRSEREEQTIVGKPEDKILIEKDDLNAGIRSTVEKGQIISQVSFGKKRSQTQQFDQNADFYAEKVKFRENQFQINEEEGENSSESDRASQIFMPNLYNRRKQKVNDRMVESLARQQSNPFKKENASTQKINQEEESKVGGENLKKQDTSKFGSSSGQKKKGWEKPMFGQSNLTSQVKNVSHFSETEMEFKPANSSDSEEQTLQIDEDEDEDEANDFVAELNTNRPGKGQLNQSNSFFDNNLPQIDQKDKQKLNALLRLSSKEALVVEKKVSKVHEMMVRASAVNRMTSGNSRISVVSNKKDFDYLFLTKSTNEKMFKPVAKILSTHGESGTTAVFSEQIQELSPELKVKDYIILVTHKSLFIMDKQCNPKKNYDLLKLRQIIIIKTNPGVFALAFGGTGQPLLLQSFRRTELIIFLNTQCQNNKPKIVISRTKGIRVFLRDKITHQQIQKVITFEKISGMNSSIDKSLLKQMEKNVQLNNFANAINSGYLKMRTSTFLLGKKWEDRFVVLTNVGLLYFTDPHQPPIDLFPVLDCEIQQVPPKDVKGNENTFRLVYLTKHVTFQSSNRAEFNNWILQITKLQKVTIVVREKLKQEEIRRMTMLMGQL